MSPNRFSWNIQPSQGSSTRRKDASSLFGEDNGEEWKGASKECHFWSKIQVFLLRLGDTCGAGTLLLSHCSGIAWFGLLLSLALWFQPQEWLLPLETGQGGREVLSIPGHLTAFLDIYPLDDSAYPFPNPTYHNASGSLIPANMSPWKATPS